MHDTTNGTINGMTNGSMNCSTNGTVHGESDDQALADTTRFDPLPDVTNILVTGGNGFMYVLAPVFRYLRNAVRVLLYNSQAAFFDD